MRASEEFYRAAANTPQFTQSPYALYHQALDRSTDRRQRLLEQQGAIAARNSEEAWKNINSIPSNAVKGYQAGLDIKGEKQRQDALARQQLIAEEQNARARDAHDLSMKADNLRLSRAQAEHDYEMSPTEEGQARWISEREQKRDLDRRSAEMGIKGQEAGIKGQESAIAFNQFQMEQARREEQARIAAATRQRAENLLAEAARMPEGKTVMAFDENGNYGPIQVPNQERQKLISDAQALMQQANMSASDSTAVLSRATREGKREDAAAAAAQATADQQLFGVPETAQRASEIRNKSAALIKYAEAVQEYEAASTGALGRTSPAEQAALRKAIDALRIVNPSYAVKLAESAEAGVFGRVGVDQGTRSSFMKNILEQEMAGLQQEAETLKQTGVFPETKSLHSLPVAIDADIRRLNQVAKSHSAPVMGNPNAVGGQSQGVQPAGAAPVPSLRHRMRAQPPAAGMAKPPQVYNQQTMLDNMWGPS